MPSILESENNYLRVFEYWVNQPEAPMRFASWAAVSTLAAAMANRTWIARKPGSRDRIYPNTYLLFLSEQGNFKSYSLHKAVSVLERSTHLSNINLYQGKVSGPSMYDEMLPTQKHPNKNLIYVVNDELATSVGSREYADQFLLNMTAMYYGSPFKDRTRTTGLVDIKNYCMNWFACSTPTTFYGVVRPHHFEGGLFTRLICIREYDNGVNVFREPALPDYDDVLSFLTCKMDAALTIEGEFRRTSEAEELEEEWYMNQAKATRKHDQLLKVAMALSIADSADLTIRSRHMAQAIEMLDSTDIPQGLREHAEARTINPKIDITDEVRSYIKSHREVQRSVLTKHASKRWGLNARDLQNILETMIEAREITTMETPRNQKGGGTAYGWIDA